MNSVVVQLHTFLNSRPDNVHRSTAHRMEAVEEKYNIFLYSVPSVN